jgi:1-acyl-sn-glycerol-3-phosphate acyltransferase
MALTESPSGFYRLAIAVSLPVVRDFYRLRVTGVEHVPSEGGLVIAANHTSNLDPWPLGCALPKRQLHYMAKSELWKPGLRTLLAAIGSFPVRRGEGDVEAFETAVRIVRNGGVMAMFPEGTRRTKGLRKKHEPRPHRGTARIALAADAPLVPAAIRGMDRLSKLGPLRVMFGPEIPLDDLRSAESFEAAWQGTERLWAEIQRLEAELARLP